MDEKTNNGTSENFGPGGSYRVLVLHIICLLSQYFRSRTQKSLYFQIYWSRGQCLQWERSGLIKTLNEPLEMKEEVWSDYSISEDHEGTDHLCRNLHIIPPQRYQGKKRKN